MEIIHVVLFVLIMVGVYYLKTRLPTQILFPLSLFIGIAMLIWFWVFWEREIPGRILITVLVLSGLYKYLENRKQKRWEN
jgi:predicted membrane protein